MRRRYRTLALGMIIATAACTDGTNSASAVELPELTATDPTFVGDTPKGRARSVVSPSRVRAGDRRRCRSGGPPRAPR